MKQKYWLWIMLLLGIGRIAPGQTVLWEDGRSRAVIVLPAVPTPAEQTAAAELQHYAALSGEVTLPIIDAVPTDGTPAILIGRHDDEDLPLQPDEIVIEVAGDRVKLFGEGSRGTLYAVYEFLERELGVRWWTASEETVPPVRRLALEDGCYRYAPPFSVREPLYTDIGEEVFAARSRANGHWQNISAAYGGHQAVLGFCHTFEQLIPPSKYFDGHPEWFGERNGVRGREGQLCLSNSEMRDELIANARQWLDERPDVQIISVTQNDNSLYCCCPECTRLAEQYGAQSGVMLQFVNAVAEELEKSHPGVIVETLAYRYTAPPPHGIRARDNVRVRLCSIEADFSRPLAEQPIGEELRRWRELVDDLAIWHYTVNFSSELTVYPNFRQFATDLRLLANNHIKAVLAQGDTHSGLYGDFKALRTWLLAKLLWNPSLDADALVETFMTGYYGKAANEVSAYFQQREALMAERPDFKLSCYVPETSGFLSVEDLAHLHALLQCAAEAADGDPVVTERIGRLEAGWNVTWLMRPEWSVFRLLNGESGPAPAVEELQTLLQRTFAVLESHGAINYCEADSLKTLERQLEKRFAAWRQPLPPQFADLPAIRVNLEELHLFGVPDWAEWRTDPLLGGAQTVFYNNTTSNWALQGPLPQNFDPHLQWRLAVAVRAEQAAVEPAAGSVLTFGYYDNLTRRSVDLTVEAAALSATEYRYFSTGPFVLSRDGYLYAASEVNPQSSGIRIAHFILYHDDRQ